MDVDRLLAGPRGRSLVWHLARTGDATELWDLERRAEVSSGSAWSFGWFATAPPRRGPLRLLDHARHRRERKAQERLEKTPPTAEQIANALAACSPSAPLDGVTIAEAFRGSVDSARYWQPAESIERYLEHPAVVEALRPTAQATVDSRVAADWDAPLAARQWRVEFDYAFPLVDGEEPEPPPSLEEWAQQVRAYEPEADTECSGPWWSAPVFIADRTTGVWPGLGPGGLFFVEDDSGQRTATVTPVDATGAKVFEISSAQAWADLCRAHPLDVTRQRTHDWGATTGRSGSWVTPDWSSVAKDWDGVHLTYAAYLEGATRAIDVEPGTASVIAGWNPDTTFWFAPPQPAGESQHWRRGDHLNWREEVT